MQSCHFLVSHRPGVERLARCTRSHHFPPNLRERVRPRQFSGRSCAVQNRANSAGQVQTGKIGGSESMASSKLDLQLDNILAALQLIVPPLSNDRHKGQSGRVAVFGGCREYTGAPYFAAISALKMGADLSHVFCAEGAATVIKSYSPELIVHPVLPEANGTSVEEGTALGQGIEDIKKWMSNFKGIVVGPGLGRELSLSTVPAVIQQAKSQDIPIVIDGDGLHAVTKEPSLVQGYSQVVLTPNYNEYKRLVAQVLGGNVDEGVEKDLPEQVRLLADRLGVTILKKGPTDIISDGKTVVESGFFGSPRRCGGQGDVLSGSVCVFTTWAKQYLEAGAGSPDAKKLEDRFSANPAILGSLAGSILVRKAAQEAFSKHRRGMLTTDLIEFLALSMDELFPATR